MGQRAAKVSRRLNTRLVRLDVGSETGSPLSGVVVHPGAVSGEHGTVDDHGGRPEGIDRLALEGGDERALLWEGDEVVRCLGLGRDGLHDSRVGCRPAVACRCSSRVSTRLSRIDEALRHSGPAMPQASRVAWSVRLLSSPVSLDLLTVLG